jgi:pimeloyl-ACP methyl ester carboxylesterase
VTVAERRYRGGEGEPMVLIHGIGGSWRNFTTVIPALEQRHEVVAVGLLGHHGCDPLPDGVRPSVLALVDGVELAMDRAGFATAHLVGNSLGGWIALELARRGRARSVVALSPGGGHRPGSLVADLTVARLLIEHRTVARFLAPRARRLAASSLARRAMFAGTVSSPERIDAIEAQDMLVGFGGTRIFRDLLASIRTVGPLDRLQEIRAPVLIGWGTRDRLLPMGTFAPRLREGIPGAEFVPLPGLGHVPMIDDPAQVARVVLDFTARHAQSPADADSSAA